MYSNIFKSLFKGLELIERGEILFLRHVNNAQVLKSVRKRLRSLSHFYWFLTVDTTSFTAIEPTTVIELITIVELITDPPTQIFYITY